MSVVKHEVPIDQLSKQQLAVLVNDYGKQIQRLLHQLRLTTQALSAIILEPEAFRPLGTGHARIDADAVDKVKDGQVLRVSRHGRIVFVRVDEPKDAQRIEIAEVLEDFFG